MTSCYRLEGIRFNRKFIVVKQACRKDTDLQEERRRCLLEDRPGLTLVTEALYVEEPGYPLDEALFALYRAAQRHEPLDPPARGLVRLLEGKADRMARTWAEWRLPRAIEEAEADDDLPF